MSTSRVRRLRLKRLILQTLLPVLLAIPVGGCVAGRADLADSGTLDVDRDASGRTRFSKPSVYADDGRLVVAGKVRRPSYQRGPARGGVRVDLISPTGEPLATATGRLRDAGGGPPPIRRSPPASYRVAFDSLPPDGSTVRLSLARRP